ncbi:MAG: SPOR domain-containing protein [Rhodocyclaceae bacterium]|nr:SPOR domain-containing protein [Rhodocyclaceae bacterium]
MKREKQARAAPPRGNHGGTLMGVFIGLVLGLVIAAGVTWYVKGGMTPFNNREARQGAPAPDTKPGEKPPQVATLPGKPGEKPRFEFYNILPGGTGTAEAKPGQQEPKPAQTEPRPSAAEQKPAPVETRTPAPAAKPEPLFLQAGAFSSAQDADNLKARLALMGLDVQVAQATVPDKGTLFRVRVGPFRDPDEASRVRSELAQAGIAASVVKP